MMDDAQRDEDCLIDKGSRDNLRKLRMWFLDPVCLFMVQYWTESLFMLRNGLEF
jgi:hypothetical protein